MGGSAEPGGRERATAGSLRRIHGRGRGDRRVRLIYDNQILIVGAMAIGPDTLPITATCTALVLGRWRCAGQAFATLTVGLVVAGVVAGAIARARRVQPAALRIRGRREQRPGLQTVNVSTPIVALAPGLRACWR